MSSGSASRRAALRELYVQPLLDQKLRVAAIAASLVAISAAIAVLVVSIRWLLPALFPAAGAGETLAVGTLVPARLLPYLPHAMQQTVGRAALAVAVPVALAFGAMLRAFANYVYQVNLAALSLEWARSYRERLFAAILALPYGKVRARSPAAWMSLAMNDVAFMQSRLSEAMTGIVRGGGQVIVGFAMLLWQHWPSAIALMALAPFIALGMGNGGRRIARYAESFQKELARLAAAVLDLRARFDFIRAQGGEARERQRYAVLNERYFETVRRSILVRSAFAPVLELGGFLVFAAFLIAVGKGVVQLESGEVMQFLAAVGLLLKPLRELGEQITRVEETRGALGRTLDLFVELERSKHALPRGASRPQGPFQLDIETVEAAYDEAAPAFRAQDLRLAAGRAVAVVGPSGAGKSTLVKVLAGLVEPRAWRASHTWPTSVAASSMVSQEPFFFDDTVYANLVYGLEGGERPSDASIWRALAEAGIDAEVRALPGGLQARVRAIGTNVSGGQLQRLTVARGLLRARPLLLLDEATAAIDAASERDLTRRLVSACRDRAFALLAVTHRLTWLDNYDEVWFVEAGSVRLRGGHRELIARDERYRRYCDESGAEAR